MSETVKPTNYRCNEYGTLPNNLLKPGDSITNYEGTYALTYQTDGNIVVSRDKEKTKAVVFEMKTQDVAIGNLEFDGASASLCFSAGKRKVPVFRFPPAYNPQAFIVSDCAFAFDSNGHLFARYASSSEDDLHRGNAEIYFRKNTLLAKESIPTSKKTLMQSRNGRYRLESSDDQKSIELKDLEFPSKPLMKLTFAGRVINKFCFQSDSITLLDKDNSGMDIVNTRSFADYLELTDRGALIASNFSGELVWSTERCTLSTDDNRYVEMTSDGLVKRTPSVLTKGQRLISPNGAYQFVFNEEGDAQLSRTSDNYILYQTNTNFQGRDFCVRVMDGNLTITKTSTNPETIVWQAKSKKGAKEKKCCLTLSDDGSLCVELDIHQPHLIHPQREVYWKQPGQDILLDGFVLHKGDKIVSLGHAYTFTLLANGNLVLYRNTKGNKGHLNDYDIQFEICTAFQGPGSLTFNKDSGQLVLSKEGGELVWKSPASSKAVSRIFLDDSGRLNFIDATGNKVDDLTLPASSIGADQKLLGRNKLLSPNSHYRLFVKDGSHVVVEDVEHNGKDIYHFTDGAKRAFSLVADSGRLVYKEHGSEVHYERLFLTDHGIELQSTINKAPKRTRLPLSSIWFSNFKLGPGITIHSPNRQFGLSLEKYCFKVIKLSDDSEVFVSNPPKKFTLNYNPTFYVQDGELFYGTEANEYGKSEFIWRSDTKGFSYLELTNDGVLRIVSENRSVWQSVRIACLAWGSLIWDQRELPVIGSWNLMGPDVKVDYLRKSDDGRMTLVLSPNSTPVDSEWILLDAPSLSKAAEVLAKREGIPHTKINDLIGTWSAKIPSPDCILKLDEWARANNIDHVVWTNLGPKNPITGAVEATDFSTILKYFNALKADMTGDKGSAAALALYRAEEYVRRTPRHVHTDFRKRFESDLGWTFDANFGKEQS